MRRWLLFPPGPVRNPITTVVQEMDRAPDFSIERLSLALSAYRPKTVGGEGLRAAGVLVPLFRRDGAWRLLLCRRSDQLDEHRGEVAFPGGRLEAEDTDLRGCALREAQEEVGVRPEDVTVLGALDQVNTRTGYAVSPTVGTLPDDYTFTANEGEVAELLEVPMEWLLEEGAIRHEAVVQPDGSLARRRTYAFGHHLVFGATARIVADLLELLAESRDVHSTEVSG